MWTYNRVKWKDFQIEAQEKIRADRILLIPIWGSSNCLWCQESNSIQIVEYMPLPDTEQKEKLGDMIFESQFLSILTQKLWTLMFQTKAEYLFDMGMGNPYMGTSFYCHCNVWSTVVLPFNLPE